MRIVITMVTSRPIASHCLFPEMKKIDNNGNKNKEEDSKKKKAKVGQQTLPATYLMKIGG